MVDFDTSGEKLYVPHICAAYKWVEEWYEINWDDGTGTVHLKKANDQGISRDLSR